MGHQDLTLFLCLEGVNPLLFSQLCVFHHANTDNSDVLGVSSNPVSQTEKMSSPKPDDLFKKKDQQNFDDVTGHIGQVMIG